MVRRVFAAARARCGQGAQKGGREQESGLQRANEGVEAGLIGDRLDPPVTAGLSRWELD